MEGSPAEVCVAILDVPVFYQDGYSFFVNIITDEPGSGNKADLCANLPISL